MRSRLLDRLLLPLSPQRRAQGRRIGALALASRLGPLATWYGTDKGPRAHGYTTHYQTHLQSRRKEHLTLLEIGVGGCETNSGGASLRMWRSFLPNAHIIGVDLYKKRLPVEPRITVVQGDQNDRSFLANLAAERGPFDIVIDDGSHRGDHINVSFDALWPHVRSSGLYVIEDLETAYEVAYGGGPPGTTGTSLSLLKELLDSVQGKSERALAAVHVYASIAFVEKA